MDQEEQPASLAVSPGDVSETLVEQGAQGDKGKYIEELVISGDPLAHDILVRMLKEDQSEAVVTKVWEGLLARARRNGLVRSSDYVRAWANTEARSPRRKATEETSLRLLDPALPIATRVELLEVVRAFDSRFSVGLAASLALDLKQLDPFQPVFLRSAAEALTGDPETLQGHSTGALMLATPEVSMLYADDIVDDPMVVSDGDIAWLLSELTKRQLPGVKRLSEVAVARALVPPVEVVFLQILGRKAPIPARVQASLVACAFGQSSKADVVSFAGWYDTDAEKALWALVGSTKDLDLGAKAFDALAAKPLLTQGISELYDYVRSTYYPDRAVVGLPVAALALENVLSDAEFSRAFEGLDRLPKSKELIKIVLKGPSARALREVMARHAPLVERTQLLDLVRHSDPTVRAVAVEALKDANDVAILKMLTDAYTNEADPIVKAAYEKHISTIRERVGK